PPLRRGRMTGIFTQAISAGFFAERIYYLGSAYTPLQSFPCQLHLALLLRFLCCLLSDFPRPSGQKNQQKETKGTKAQSPIRHREAPLSPPEEFCRAPLWRDSRLRFATIGALFFPRFHEPWAGHHTTRLYSLLMNLGCSMCL